jgi:hypothetical protein
MIAMLDENKCQRLSLDCCILLVLNGGLLHIIRKIRGGVLFLDKLGFCSQIAIRSRILRWDFLCSPIATSSIASRES